MTRTRFSFPTAVHILAILLPILLVALPACSEDGPYSREIKMGREAAKEIEKDHTLVTDPATTERIHRLGGAIAAVANSLTVEATYGSSDIAQFDYQFKVIEDDSVNAFSLPGGFIYIHKGLLSYVQSDHELAAVLAHEVAHSAHHHMVHLLREQSKLDGQIAFLLLAGVLGGVNSRDLGNLLMGAQLVRIAKTSGYGQRAEWDADATGVIYLRKAGYNPVGMLTFMERLSRDSAGKPDLELGILQTHPAPRERCKQVLSQIKLLNLPINRRAVTNALKAATEPATIKGQQIVRVTLGQSVLFEPAPIGNIITSEQRARAVTTKINQFLDSEPGIRDVTLRADGRAVLARGEPIIVVTEQDATLHDRPCMEMATQAADALRNAIWREMLERLYY